MFFLPRNARLTGREKEAMPRVAACGHTRMSQMRALELSVQRSPSGDGRPRVLKPWMGHADHEQCGLVCGAQKSCDPSHPTVWGCTRNFLPKECRRGTRSGAAQPEVGMGRTPRHQPVHFPAPRQCPGFRRIVNAWTGVADVTFDA